MHIYSTLHLLVAFSNDRSQLPSLRNLKGRKSDRTICSQRAVSGTTYHREEQYLQHRLHLSRDVSILNARQRANDGVSVPICCYLVDERNNRKEHRLSALAMEPSVEDVKGPSVATLQVSYPFSKERRYAFARQRPTSEVTISIRSVCTGV